MRLYHLINADPDPVARPCRYCGQPAYTEEPDDDVAHPCCREQMGRLGLPRCQSCDASAAAQRAKNTRRKAKPPEPPPKPEPVVTAPVVFDPPNDALYRPDLDPDFTWGELRASQMIAMFDLLREAEGSWVTAPQIAQLGGTEYLLLLRSMVDDQGLEIRVRTRGEVRQFRLA